MKSQYLNLADGSLEIQPDKLLITDDAGKNRIFNILQFVFVFIYSVSLVVVGIREDDSTQFYFGAALMTAFLLLLILKRINFKKAENQIRISEIEKAAFKFNSQGDIFVKLILKSKNIRKITLVNEEDQDFVLKKILLERDVVVD